MWFVNQLISVVATDLQILLSKQIFHFFLIFSAWQVILTLSLILRFERALFQPQWIKWLRETELCCIDLLAAGPAGTLWALLFIYSIPLRLCDCWPSLSGKTTICLPPAWQLLKLALIRATADASQTVVLFVFCIWQVPKFISTCMCHTHACTNSLGAWQRQGVTAPCHGRLIWLTHTGVTWGHVPWTVRELAG